MSKTKSATAPGGAGDGALEAESGRGDVNARTAAVGKWRLLGAATLFAGLGFAGAYFTRPVDPPAEPVAAEAEHPPAISAAAAAEPPLLELPAEIEVAPIAEALPVVDEYLRVGDNQSAQTAYQRLSLRATGAAKERIDYRLALVAELSGELENAGRMYQTLFEGAQQAAVQRAAWFGRARVSLAAGHLKSAESQLAAELLADQGLESHQPQASAESAYLLARCLTREFLGESKRDLLADDAALHFPAPEQPAALLRMADAPPPANTPGPNTANPGDPPRVAIVRRYGSDPETIQVDVHLSNLPLIDVVSRLAEDAGLRIAAGDTASQRLAHRETSVRQSNANLAIILDRLLIPLGICWKTNGHLLQISSQDELDDAALQLFQQQAALRAIRQVSIVHPDHRLAQYVDYQLGRIHFESEEYEHAVQSFTRFLTQHSRSPVRQAAWFNLAKAHLMTGDEPSAIKAFYHVIDNGREYEIAHVSYLYVGRLQLELGRYGSAAKPLLTAITSATDPRIKSRGIVTLAEAYALSQNYSAATSLLVQYAEDVEAATVRGDAELVSQFVRFQVADDAHVEQAGAMLVGSLAMYTPDPFLQSASNLLRSEAYHVLGLLSQQSVALAAALDQSRMGAARQRLSLVLVDTLTELGELAQAESRLDEALSTMRDPWRMNGRLKQVELCYLQGKTGRCLELCAKLIQDSNDLNVRKTALSTMGRVYQDGGDFENAAVCFAGMLPAQVAADHLRTSETTSSKW